MNDKTMSLIDDLGDLRTEIAIREKQTEPLEARVHLLGPGIHLGTRWYAAVTTRDGRDVIDTGPLLAGRFAVLRS